MPRPASTIEQRHRDYIREHYRSRGTAACCRATGLDIYQVWGLADRMGINIPRGPQRKTRQPADNGSRGTPAKRYSTTELQAALQSWTASAEPSAL